MESIQELREKLQREKLEGRERPWGYRLLQRGPSIYITKLFLKTPITPNQLTLLSIAFGITGSIFVLGLTPASKLAGIFFLYLNLVFDRVDGEVARYKGIYSLKGIFLDELNHLLVPPLFFLALTLGLAPFTTLHPGILMGAGLAGAASLMIIRLLHNIPYQIYLKKYFNHKELFSLPEQSQTRATLRTQYGFIYSIVKIVHQFQDLLTILILFTLAFIIEYAMPDSFLFPISSQLVIAYGIFLALITLEDLIKGVLTIEGRVAEISKNFEKVQETAQQQ